MYSDNQKKNIYNNIQNVYNMEFKTWEEVLAVMYNLVGDTSQKFNVFQQKFIIELGKEVGKAMQDLYLTGQLADIINKEIFKKLNNKIDMITNTIPRNWVTPEQFGAVGDGIADDTIPLQKAFNYDYILLSNKYKYSSTNQFINRKNVHIISFTNAELINSIGDNRTEQETSENIGLSFDNCENVTIDGITFNMCFYGIRIRNSKNITIKNTNYHTFRFALYMYGVDRITVNNFHVNNKRTTTFNWNDGIHINGYAKNIYINNVFGSADDDLIAITPSETSWETGKGDIENLYIDGVYTYGVAQNDLGVQQNTTMRPIRINPALKGYKVKNVNISNCYLGSDREECVFFNGTGFENSVIEDVTFTNCYFYQNKPQTRRPVIGFNGITVENIKFINCTFRRNKASYFPAFICTASGENGQFSGNNNVKIGTLIIDNAKCINETGLEMSLLQHRSLATIHKLVIRNTYFSPSLSTNMVLISNNVDYLYFEDNTIYNNTGKNGYTILVSSGVVTNLLASNNIVRNGKSLIKIESNGQIRNILEGGTKMTACISSIIINGTDLQDDLIITQNNLIYDKMIDDNDESVTIFHGGNIRFKDVVLSSYIPHVYKNGDKYIYKDVDNTCSLKIANNNGWQ